MCCKGRLTFLYECCYVLRGNFDQNMRNHMHGFMENHACGLNISTLHATGRTAALRTLVTVINIEHLDGGNLEFPFVSLPLIRGSRTFGRNLFVH